MVKYTQLTQASYHISFGLDMYSEHFLRIVCIVFLWMIVCNVISKTRNCINRLWGHGGRTQKTPTFPALPLQSLIFTKFPAACVNFPDCLPDGTQYAGERTRNSFGGGHKNQNYYAYCLLNKNKSNETIFVWRFS